MDDRKLDLSGLLNIKNKTTQKPLLKKDVSRYFKVDEFDIVEKEDEDVFLVDYNGKQMPLTLFYTLVCVHDGNITEEIFIENAK